MAREIGRGAEASIFLVGDSVQKIRFSKRYRLPVLDDELRHARTKREAKVVEKLHVAGVSVPKVISIDEKKAIITFEYLDAPKLRDVLDKNPELFGAALGKLVGQVHSVGIIHGDLSTSNILAKGKKLYLLDFGLSFFSIKEEDMAVDIHVLEQILLANHTAVASKTWTGFLKGYKETLAMASKVLARLEQVRMRGRHKHK